MTGRNQLRADVLRAFGLTEQDLDALDPDGSYAAARAAVDAEHDAFRHVIETRARQAGKTLDVAIRTFSVAAAGEHVHALHSSWQRCWNGDDQCPLWREQQTSACPVPSPDSSYHNRK